MLTVDSPATIFDMAELGGARTHLHWVLLKDMWANGQTYALRNNGALIGLFGICDEDGVARVWFSVTPEVAPHMRFIIREVQLTLSALSYPEIIAICGTEAGKRIARLSGFHFSHAQDSWEIWRYGRNHRQQCTETGRSGKAPTGINPTPPAR